MSNITLTDADNGKTIQVQVGAEIMINLKENPTTGYRWAVDQADDKVLPLQSSNYAITPGGGVGGGGIRTFTFIAKQPGTVHLQLKQWRDFVGNSSIINRYNVTIQVQS